MSKMAIANIKHADHKSSFYIAISEISTSHKTFKLNKFEKFSCHLIFKLDSERLNWQKGLIFLKFVSENTLFSIENSKSYKILSLLKFTYHVFSKSILC